MKPGQNSSGAKCYCVGCTGAFFPIICGFGLSSTMIHQASISKDFSSLFHRLVTRQ